MHRLILLLVPAALAAGCTTDDTMRLDGMTYGAGDAIAANTVLQMVDPWQDGVQHTDLRVPAERPQSQAAATGGEGTSTTDGGGSKTTADK